MMIFAWAALLQVTVSPLLSSLDPVGVQPVGTARPTIIHANWRGRPAEVRVTSTKLAGCNALAPLFYGVSGNRADTCAHLSDISVTLAGKPLMIPQSAYTDLGDVHQAMVRTTPQRLELDLWGSESAEDYGATLSFDRGGLIQRRIHWPDGSAEITTYVKGKIEGE